MFEPVQSFEGACSCCLRGQSSPGGVVVSRRHWPAAGAVADGWGAAGDAGAAGCVALKLCAGCVQFFLQGSAVAAQAVTAARGRAVQLPPFVRSCGLL